MPELALDGAFEWVRFPWGPAIRCRPLSDHADHCFTTRQPHLPSVGGRSGDGWQRLAFSLEVPRSAIVRLQQVHGTGVVTVRKGDVLPSELADWAAADAAVTDDGRVALCVRVADCVPLLVADRRAGAVAAAHAGWRGTAAGMAGAAIGALGAAFGSRPEDLVAAIGPSIGPCCYRVGPEVREAFAAGGAWDQLLDDWFSAAPTVAARREVPGAGSMPKAPQSWLDLWRATADQLAVAGVPSGQIHASRLCTACYREVFHSYRVDGQRAGRMAGVIRRREKESASSS